MADCRNGCSPLKGIDTFHVTPNPIDIILVEMDVVRLRALIHFGISFYAWSIGM